MSGPRRLLRVAWSCCLVAGVSAVATAARAQASLINGFGGVADYGTQCLSPNDDGSSAVIDITPAFPNGLHFFTGTHTSAYVNTNGNITFSGRVSTYTPYAFPVSNQPMIAPYWGDVDIRYTGGYCQGSAGVTCTVCTPCHNPTENGVWWYLEPGRMVVTWDRTGYYSCHNDKRMSFQLILTAAGCGGQGDFDVEFRYNRCEWETGDASGGSSGFGGTEAQAGFDAGNGADYVAIPGSMAPGIANLLCTDSNVGETGIWRFQIRSGSIVCPDAGQPCDTGLLGVCAAGRTNCVGSGTECVQDVQATEEECDALDNDCDGSVDEADSGALCAAGLLCVLGNCVQSCTEFGCPDGMICDNSGLCVEQACVGVTCEAGMRCVGGTCVGACDNVTCPTDRDCRAGSCINLCAGLSCDDCTVCEHGVCVARCQYTPCEDDETCLDDGRCIATACVGVTCDPGFHCEGGTCIDSCLGAACPQGQVCATGECVDEGEVPEPDGGTGAWFPEEDSGAGATGAGTPQGGGAPSGGAGGGDAADGADEGGCGCRAAGGSRLLGNGLLALALGALAVARRRRHT